MRAHALSRFPRVPLILAATGALVLTAAPAALAATWTVTPGGHISGGGAVALTDATSNSTVASCELTLAGTLKSGSGLSGKGIGQFTSIGFTNCTGQLGSSFSITATPPWTINVLSDVSGSVTGSIGGIHLAVSGPACSFVVDGTSATSRNGTEKFKISGTKWKLLPTTSNMHFWSVSGCLGLISSGDKAALTGTLTITPAQTITSP